ncbi:MAG: hypothetical protein PVH41_12300 [Anaerolineae bacterium]
MRSNPERLAWVVLLTSFFVCLALSVMTPVSARWYVRRSTMTQDVSLEVQRGPLSVVRGGRGRPVSVAQDSDNVLEGSRIEAPNATSGRLVIEATQSQSTTPIATIQLYDETAIVLASARSPRFSSSPLPHQVSLEMEDGRVRLNVFGDSDRSTIVEVQTVHGLLTLYEGSFEVKVNSLTEATVRYGQAELRSKAGAELPLGPRERALLDDEELEGPLPAARNLVGNGDFAEPLSTGWNTYAEQADPKQPPGSVQIATTLVGNEDRTVAQFYRNAVNHAQVGILQDINYDVRDFDSLELHMAVRVLSENILGLGGCGSMGSECPIIVRLDYKDVHGSDREWLRGFYIGEPADGWPVLGWHERLQPRSWQPYNSGNLMEELAGTPASITSISIYASGHSFDAMVTEVELLAQE